MKRFLATLCSGLVLSVLPVAAQAPGAGDNQQQVLALVKDVLTQQAQISDNQTKIESKMTEVTEAVRVARIYAGRSGK